MSRVSSAGSRALLGCTAPRRPPPRIASTQRDITKGRPRRTLIGAASPDTRDQVRHRTARRRGVEPQLTTTTPPRPAELGHSAPPGPPDRRRSPPAAGRPGRAGQEPRPLDPHLAPPIAPSPHSEAGSVTRTAPRPLEPHVPTRRRPARQLERRQRSPAVPLGDDDLRDLPSRGRLAQQTTDSHLWPTAEDRMRRAAQQLPEERFRPRRVGRPSTALTSADAPSHTLKRNSTTSPSCMT